MTALSGPIIVSSTAGSNTAASGLGPATAVFGTGASTTAASAVADVSADSPDLSGVSAGDLMWIDSTSGIQFNVIASVDDGADTVTCDVVWANTEGSRNWGIGGKRASLIGSLSLGIDALSGWIIELASAHTESSGTKFFISAGGITERITLRGEADAATRPSVAGVNVAQTIDVSGQSWTLHGFDMSCDGTNDIALFLDEKYGEAYDMDIRCVGTASGMRCVEFSSESVHIRDCLIDGNDASGGRGVYMATGNIQSVRRCTIKNCADAGVSVNRNSSNTTVADCDISGCGNGIDNPAGNGNGNRFENNRIYDSASAGILMDDLDNTQHDTWVQNNIIVNSGTYHIDYNPTNADADDAERYGIKVYDNAFYNATSGNLNNLNDNNNVQLTADPFVNAAAGDFNINDTAGGGTVLRAITKIMPV